MEALRTGQRILVHYEAEGDEPFWHERLLTAPAGPGKWMICTPDEDYYVECLVHDVTAWVPVGPRGGVPVQVRGQEAYRFNDGDLVGRALAARLAAGRREMEALGAEVAPAAPADPPAAAAEAHGDPGGWVLLEAGKGKRAGESVALPIEAVIRGDRALFEDDGVWMAAARAGTMLVVTGAGARAEADKTEDDLRTLSVKYDAQGQRHRDFKEAVAKQTETSFTDWPVTGPRTARWVLGAMSREELTPLRRHAWWRSTLRLGPSDFGVGEHETISRAVELAMTYDQVVVAESAAFEVLLRRYQLLEERYARQLQEAEVGRDLEDREFEQSLFLGVDGGRGAALVCPALTEWISQRLRDEATVMKERRKGREERQLARGSEVEKGAPPPPKGGKKQ